MRVESFPDTRTVYLSLVDEPRPATETREISEGLNVDYDSEGRVIGIEIEDTDLLQKAQTPRHERVKPSANIVLTFHVNVEGQSAPVSYETSLSNIIHLADFMHEMESVDRHIDPEFKRMFPWLPHRPGERKSLK
jgi:uncharacterized protein YuzE